MKRIMIAIFLICVLVLIVGCEKTGQTVNVAKEEQEGKLIKVKEQSVEIHKPTSTPTSVPSTQDSDSQDQQQNLSNEELIEQLSEGKGFVNESADVDESSDEDDSEQSTDSESETILILNFKGNPSELEVKAGTTVIWENADVYGHVIGIFKVIEGPMLKKGETWSYIFNEPGNYTWMSMGHPKTNGNVIVTE